MASRQRPRRGSRVRIAVALLVAVLVAVSDPASPVGPAAGAPGLRYVDPIFDGVDVTRDIVYATPPGADGVPVALKADVYEGRGDSTAARRVVVLVHGGGFTKGSKAELRQEGIDFARRGYVAVAVDYRLRLPPTMSWCDGAPFGPGCDPRLVAAMTDAAADVGAAVDMIRRTSADMGVDPGAVAVYGYSAGAITSLYLAHRTLPGTGGEAAATPPIQAAVSLMGAIAPADVAAGAAPALMVHGTEDPVVSYAAAVAAQAAASARGDDARLVTVPGAGHAFDAAEAAAAEAHTIAFLDDVLQPRGRARVDLSFSGAFEGSVVGRLASGDIAARTVWGGAVAGLAGAGRVATPAGVADVSVALKPLWILPVRSGSITVSAAGIGTVTTPLLASPGQVEASTASGSANWSTASGRPYTLAWSISPGARG